MQLARSMHGSCTVNNSLYVIGGQDDTDSDLSSIEQLIVTFGYEGEVFSASPKTRWRLFQIDGLPPRNRPFICPLDKDTIAICGGGSDGDSDCYVWNLVNKTINGTSKADNAIEFRSWNCGKLIHEGLSVVLITDTKSLHIKLVEFDHADQQIKVVKDFGHEDLSDELDQKIISWNKRMDEHYKIQADWKNKV